MSYIEQAGELFIKEMINAEEIVDAEELPDRQERNKQTGKGKACRSSFSLPRQGSVRIRGLPGWSGKSYGFWP